MNNWHTVRLLIKAINCVISRCRGNDLRMKRPHYTEVVCSMIITILSQRNNESIGSDFGDACNKKCFLV